MKKYLIALGIALFLSNIYWLYKILDMSVTYTYQQETLDDKNKAIEILGKLIIDGAKDYSKKDMLVTLRKNYPSAFIVEDENAIRMKSVTFIYDKDELKNIKTL